MKIWQLPAFIGILFLLSGCCDCFDSEPFLEVRFRNYSPEELKTVYILSGDKPDTCFTCVDTLTQTGYFFPNPYTTYQVKSDSIPLNKTIQVNKIRAVTSRYFFCPPCKTVTGIDYDLDGDKYSDEPIVITK